MNLEEKVKELEIRIGRIEKLLHGSDCGGFVATIGIIDDIRGMKSIVQMLHPEVYGKKK